jgi:hypothetical protein
MGVEERNRLAASDAVSELAACGALPADLSAAPFAAKRTNKRLDTQDRDDAPDFSAPERAT